MILLVMQRIMIVTVVLMVLIGTFFFIKYFVDIYRIHSY